jgi:hypothetical protein
MSEFEWIDDCFRVEQKRWGTWDSYNKEGKAIITSLTREQCINATRFYLKGNQEGWEDSKQYDGKVGGKL